MKYPLKSSLLIICSFFFSGTAALAQGFDNLPVPGEEKVVDNTPDSIAKALTARPAPGSTRKGTNPVLFLVGNSTMRNGTLGNGNNGQWGWGYFFPKYFDAEKISVENQALGGMSTRTFYTDLWPAIRQALKPGDWVIVSIGHNDHADFFDARRARGVIDGVDPDTMVTGFNQRTQRQDTVYSYGRYLRKYIREIRAKGANPVLMSLTPRNAYDEKTGKIVRKPQTEWAAYVAATEGVPFIDLNEISGKKLDSFSRWKVNYHFLGDKIHTSKFGAELNANSAAMGIFNSNNPQLKSLKAMMKVDIPFRYITTSGKPRLFFTGDSTVKNADKDDDGMWGWASQAQTVFDESKITLINAGRAGRSTRTFINEGLWERVYDSLQPGDYVTIQFGHNDICPITDAKGRGVIPGTQDTLHVYRMDNGSYEVVYSFGWYLRKMIDDCRQKGATPILVSLTPRNEWPGGKVERRDDSYGKWYREVVEQTGVEFIDMHNISADFLDKKFAVKKLSDDKEKAKAQVAAIKEKAGVYFKQDHTHASKLGAQMNAQSFAKGLKASGSGLAKYLK
jgi:lysophospholipase L1-like esterase